MWPQVTERAFEKVQGRLFNTQRGREVFRSKADVSNLPFYSVGGGTGISNSYLNENFMALRLAQRDFSAERRA